MVSGIQQKQQLFTVFGPLMLTAYLILGVLTSAAQTRSITIQPSKAQINAANEDLINLVVKIRNGGSDTLQATLNVSPPNDIEPISKKSFSVLLAPGDSSFVAVKIFITRKANAGMVHSVKFILQRGGQLIAESQTRIQVSVKKDVNLLGLLPDIILENMTDSITIPLRVTNSGNSMQRVHVTAQYPARHGSGSSQTLQLALPAYSDTLISFRRIVDQDLMDPSGARITILGMYQSGEVFGITYTRIQSARRMRNYNAENLLGRYDDNNSITLSAQNIANQNEAYNLSGRGTIMMPSGRLSYNLDATTWKNSTYSPTMVRNTWLNIESNNIGIKAGNISRNIELNLNGRGASAWFTDTARNNYYEAGYISSNSNLLGTYYGFFPAGEAAWGSFRHRQRSWQLQSSAVYETSPLLNAKNYIVSNEFSFLNLKNFKVATSLNLSHQEALRTPGTGKPGFATALSAHGQIDKLRITSTNFFSTPYYAGLRKGALSLSQRATWLGEISTLWASLNYNRYQPKSLRPAFLPEYSYLRAELGFSKKMFDGFTLSLGPRFTSEQNNAYQLAGVNGDPALTAWGFSGALNYSITPTQFLSADMESGLYTFSPGNETRLHARATINYQHRIFNINAMLQSGNFYIGEVVNNALTPDKENRLISITPTVNYGFFRNKTRLAAGVSYLYSSITGTNAALTARIDQDILEASTLFVGLNHNRYKYSEGFYNYNMIEAGITQKLARLKLGIRDHSLTIALFHDTNRNNVFDEGDTHAANQTVYINESIFRTRADGSVTYKNLPTGEYYISLPGHDGWHAPAQTIPVNRKTKVQIPLHRTGTVKGRIIYEANQFSYEILRNVAGITIQATDEYNKTYTTRTNVDGAYVFYIPAGRYSIRIDEASLQPEVEPAFSTKTVIADPQKVNTLDLELNVKARRRETKKFTSPGLQR